jgi:hypothetical protein
MVVSIRVFTGEMWIEHILNNRLIKSKNAKIFRGMAGWAAARDQVQGMCQAGMAEKRVIAGNSPRCRADARLWTAAMARLAPGRTFRRGSCMCARANGMSAPRRNADRRMAMGRPADRSIGGEAPDAAVYISLRRGSASVPAAALFTPGAGAAAVGPVAVGPVAHSATFPNARKIFSGVNG